MKLYWKILISSIIIFTITFATGGYVLISSFFSATLNNEKKMAQEENELIYFLVFHAVSENTAIMLKDYEDIEKYVISVINQLDKKKHIVRVRDEDNKIIFENENTNKMPINDVNISYSQRLSKVLEVDGKHIFHTSCRLTILNNNYIIESFRDISEVFNQRDIHVKLYQKLMFILLGVNIVIFALISFFITRPITQLSKTARKITQGELNQRVNIKTHDEVGQLAMDFNKMSDHLQKNIQQLEESATRQKQFTGSFAHELKTPLTSIIGYADLLRSHSLSEEDRLILSNNIFNEGKRIETLSFQLMDLIVMEKKDFILKKVNINNQLEKIISIFPKDKIQDKTILLSAEDCWVRIEPTLFQSLIHNLIDNSVKATNQYGKIKIVGKKVINGYEISIADNGKGIPTELIPKIREAFFVVDKSRSKSRAGVGLGLSICYAIMEIHKGRIDIKSQENLGTEVILTFGEDSNEI